ncbi:MAG: extracellular solute-binding protein [Pseudomonadota bacterium]
MHHGRFQSLLGSHGGRPMTDDKSDITFDGEAGLAAASLYRRFTTEAGMSSMSQNDARQAFLAGTLGLFFESSSLLKRFEEGAAGNFDLKVMGTPVVADEDVYFPTGGSAIVMLTDDAEKRQAVWDYIAFVTGPEGQKIIVQNTGYAPANKIVLDDESYMGAYYAANPNAVPGHAQVAAHAGPWYAYPGSEGVAVTDLIVAALLELTEGGEVSTTITDLADTLRLQLGMN